MIHFPDKFHNAIKAVIEASEAIMEIYAGDFEKMIKEDGSPVTIADLTSSKIIQKYLEKTNIPITGEETVKTDFSERKNWIESWCVDPLDGTKEFLRKNGEFVINIALIKNQLPIWGVIGSPVRREIIFGGKDFGAFQAKYEDAFMSEKWRKLEMLPSTSQNLHLISSRSHFSGNLLELVQSLEANYGKITSENMGSALKFFELVNNRAQVYPRLAPTMEWDIAAGQAIYEAIGGQVINVKTGKSLIYNKENLKNPYFVALNSAIPFSYRLNE